MRMMCPGHAGKRHSHKRATATQKEGEAEGCSGQAQAEPVGQSGLGAGHRHWHALPGGRPLLVRMALRALPRRTSTAHQHGELNPQACYHPSSQSSPVAWLPFACSPLYSL